MTIYLYADYEDSTKKVNKNGSLYVSYTLDDFTINEIEY
jgi:hypothetical protein